MMPKDDPPKRTRQVHLTNFHELVEAVLDYEKVRKKARGANK